MGGMAQEEMSKTPNSESVREQSAQLSTSNLQLSGDASTSNIKNRTSYILRRIVDLIVAGVFIYAGAIKALDPVQFANDIDNYKIFPWPISVALAFYLPWLEIFCGFALVVRLLYRGALSILTTLILTFTLVTIAAKVRGLDITCGCFGHASQNWSFPSHLATNLAILAALVVLSFKAASGNRPQSVV